MRQTIVAVFSFIPVLRLPLNITVRCNDFTLEFHGIDVEDVVVTSGLCAKPNVLCIIFLVRLRPSAFFPFPRDSVPNAKTVFQYRSDVHRSLPIRTYVNGAIWFESR